MSHKLTSISKSTETWEALSLVTFKKQRCYDSHQTKRNKKTLRKTRFQQDAKSHSKTFSTDGLIAIRDFPVDCHPPKGWIAGIHGEWGKETNISEEEDRKETGQKHQTKEKSSTVPIEVIPYGIRNVPGSLRNRITEVEDPEDKGAEAETEASQAQVKTLSIKDLRIMTTAAFNTLYQWYLCL